MTPTDKTPAATRRDGVDGCPVVLADGRSWFLADPGRFVQPRFPGHPEYAGDPDAGAQIVPTPGYPSAVMRRVDAVRVACQMRDVERTRRALESLGTLLLQRAHDLSRDEAASLFRLDPDRFSRVADAILSTVLSEVNDDR